MAIISSRYTLYNNEKRYSSLSLSLLAHVCSYLLECNDVIRVNWRCRIDALYPRGDATINREAARRCPPLIYKTMIRGRFVGRMNRAVSRFGLLKMEKLFFWKFNLWKYWNLVNCK